MVLTKRGNVYHVSFYAGGKRFRFSTGKSDKNEARKYAEQKFAEISGTTSENEVYNKIKAKISENRILDFNSTWEQYCSACRQTEREKRQTKSVFDDFTEFCRKNRVEDVSDVDYALAAKYINRLAEAGRTLQTTYSVNGRERTVPLASKKLSARTVNDYNKRLSRIFSKLVLFGSLKENPFIRIERLPERPVERKIFTREQLIEIADKSRGTALYSLFLTAYCTAMRERDICDLRWEQVDLADGWIIKKQHKTSEEVTLPILPPLRDHLLSLPKNSEYVFPELHVRYHQFSGAISSWVKDFLENTCKIETTVKVEGRSRRQSVLDVHSFRHLFASVAAENNVPLPVVQSMLGHSSQIMTQHYAKHTSRQAQKRYINNLPMNSFGGESPIAVPALPLPPETESIRELLLSMTEGNWKDIRDKIIAML